ncbi:hydroxyacid dehydrogenase [Lentzea flava]|uniref:2-hydroxyacid dehydrogenase n=1 Tax=Lentzea flava TaxID=103732 RepID=A0ABQ2UNP9_9PSEU|nr:hydroxyacid dehydrogenase [Lentzea flava]MCP2200545.1 Phosphoglycerate dehydrogenase [Lentzea flava]GGU43407.1 2-hydroxyacid dehydrogenase [Lentzea flava]
MRAGFAMSAEAAKAVLTPSAIAAFGEVCDLLLPVRHDFAHGLADVDVLITGWDCPPLDAAVLDTAPSLRAIVHTAGSVRGHVTAECWARGIEVSSAAVANALPVAEYTLAMILLSGKRVLERARDFRATRDPGERFPRDVGNFGRTIGVLSASMIGRRVIELLRPFDFHVLLYDPFVSAAEAAALGVEHVGLKDLFARSDVVSVHTPLLPATRGLVSRELLDLMRPGATLINTARGALVDQEALASSGVAAVLDVTDPEVLPPGHPLWDCDNVVITPHLAGSQGNEWARLAETALAELRRWIGGAGFAHAVLPVDLGRIA